MLATERMYDSKNARFDVAAKGLTEDYFRRNVPSVMAREAHASRSDRFRPIATFDIIQAMEAEGFLPVAAKQSTSRDATRREFTKHLIRFRRNDGKIYNVGDTVFEVLLKNGNDGSACYELLAGLFRVRCQNSLVAMSQQLETIKIRHTGNDVQHRVIDGTYRVLEESEKALAAPQDWGAIKVTEQAALVLAETAHELRFAGNDNTVSDAIAPRQLLTPKRMSDSGDDLWTRFNVVQENCLKGGLRGRAATATGRSRRVTTRAINGIDQDVKLNRALWAMAEKMAQLLKTAN